MINPKEMLKEKTVAQYACYTLLLAGLIVDIAFIAVNGGDQTFTIGCFVCVLLGSLIGLADLFVRIDSVPVFAASLLYACACAFHLHAALPSISDLWNGVNFIGGNQSAAIGFGIVFLVIAVGLVVLNFFGFTKKSH